MPGVEELFPADPRNLRQLAAEAVDLEAQGEHLGEQLGRGVKLEIGLEGRTGFAADSPDRLALESEGDAHRRADFMNAQLSQRIRRR